jgi:hypothetical protein
MNGGCANLGQFVEAAWEKETILIQDIEAQNETRDFGIRSKNSTYYIMAFYYPACWFKR